MNKSLHDFRLSIIATVIAIHVLSHNLLADTMKIQMINLVIGLSFLYRIIHKCHFIR